MHLSPALRPGSFRLRPRRLGRDAMTSHPLASLPLPPANRSPPIPRDSAAQGRDDRLGHPRARGPHAPTSRHPPPKMFSYPNPYPYPDPSLTFAPLHAAPPQLRLCTVCPTLPPPATRNDFPVPPCPRVNMSPRALAPRSCPLANLSTCQLVLSRSVQPSLRASSESPPSASHVNVSTCQPAS